MSTRDNRNRLPQPSAPNEHGVSTLVVFGKDGTRVEVELSALDLQRYANTLKWQAHDAMAAVGELDHASKGDLLTTVERERLALIPFTANGTGVCSGCGEPLPTELAFADHFRISRADRIAGLWNLGYCPAERDAS